MPRNFDPAAAMIQLRAWADEKIQGGEEPPWAWYQYMKLIETLDAILGGMESTTTENSPRLAAHRGKLLQLKVARSRQDTSQLHRAGSKVQMPM